MMNVKDANNWREVSLAEREKQTYHTLNGMS